ncbi:hypothetical protein [Nocardia aurea]|uniref:hypothetical protein n=1 Tax=Nocardia aurea TaxID=2144174 RepID=UPI001300298F|nr:hypothetical protein [Nocardia aurea]
MTTIEDPDQLDALPVGSAIVDSGLRATKTSSGGWLYPHGQYWEPGLPCKLASIPND